MPVLKDNAAPPLALQVQAASPDLDTNRNPFSFCFSPSVLMRVMEEDGHYILDRGPSLLQASRKGGISPSKSPRPNAGKRLRRENNEQGRESALVCASAQKNIIC